MHFSIPETEECKDETGGYTLFKIHVNGAHHCSVRFSQLHNLNEQLKKEFPTTVPPFPPKKIFSLSLNEKEDRRHQLERFLQQISQIPSILSSDLFVNFFLNAQKETQKEAEIDVDIDVYLMDSRKMTLEIKSYEQTESILERIANQLGLSSKYTYYFGIYLVKKNEQDNQIEIVRKFQDFESPYLSLKSANKLKKHRILLRKSILDLTFEPDLYDDDVAVDLIYIQAVAELNNGLIEVDKPTMKQLRMCEEKESKRDFLKLIINQRNYGLMHFRQCVCDYPDKKTNVSILLGNKFLKLKILSEVILFYYFMK
jgi:sorting nexin-17